MTEELEERPGEKLAKALLEVAIGATAGYLVAEVYTKVMTPRQKKAWESWIKMHHGEAGVLMAGSGMATGTLLLARRVNSADSASQSMGRLTTGTLLLAGAGFGLMVHDRSDYGKWFSGDKQELYPQKA